VCLHLVFALNALLIEACGLYSAPECRRRAALTVEERQQVLELIASSEAAGAAAPAFVGDDAGGAPAAAAAVAVVAESKEVESFTGGAIRCSLVAAQPRFCRSLRIYLSPQVSAAVHCGV
jgi:hypothetical protein